MSDLNMANRQCCEVDIRDYKTKEPFMFVDFCNTTTAGFTGDSVYAKKMGQKAIAFHNPIEGTMSLEFQCLPFRIYALLSDGTIQTDAFLAEKQLITCTVAGEITLPAEVKPVVGSVFVYKEGEFGIKKIEGTFAADKFTATVPTDIAINTSYDVGYISAKATGIQRVSFNNKRIPKDFRIEQITLDKTADGDLVAKRIIAYKATPKRNFEISNSSEGDPASVKIEFDLLMDGEGNVLDIVGADD